MWTAFIARHTSSVTRSRILQQGTCTALRFTSAIANDPADTIADDPEDDVKNWKIGRNWGFEKPLRDVIVQQKIVDWDKVRDVHFPEVTRESRTPLVIFPAAVFRALNSPEDISHLRQFVHHVGLENMSPTLLTKYMKVCDDPDEINRCWKIISPKSSEIPIFDLMNGISGLLRGPQWPEAVGIVEENLQNISCTQFTDLCRLMFENGRDDHVYRWFDSVENPPAIGNYADSCMEDPKRAERYLSYMTKKGAPLWFQCRIVENKSWEKHYHVQPCKISHYSKCLSCGTNLPPGKLTDEEFSALRKASADLLIKQGDIYLTSNPEEWKNFNRFMKKYGPFEVVIDGLNLAFKQGDPALYIEAVCHEYLKQDLRKILIVIKLHVAKLFRKLHLPPEVIIYAVSNSSKDDPYVIIGALESNAKCRIFTSDFFRDHLFKLKKFSAESPRDMNFGDLFLNWLATRKDSSIIKKNRSLRSHSGAVALARAPSHFVIPHRDPQGYHLPDKFRTGLPQRWLCLRRRSGDPVKTDE